MGRLVNSLEVGKAFSGHIKENPLADIIRRTFKQLRGQAGGRDRPGLGSWVPSSPNSLFIVLWPILACRVALKITLRTGPGNR